MKKLTMKMKILTLILLTLANISFASDVEGFDIPTVFDEGLQTELTQEQVDELLPWVNQSKLRLEDMVEAVSGMSLDNKITAMITGIRDVVLKSAPKHSELLMRYTLNRGVRLVEILGEEADMNQRGVKEAQLRILKQSVQFALKYYEIDKKYIEQSSSFQRTQYAAYGIDFSKFLFELNKSILDASAQYALARLNLALLRSDLHRDLANKRYADDIFKLHLALSTLPEKGEGNDQLLIDQIRKIKKVYYGLTFGQAIANAREKELEELKRLRKAHQGDSSDEMGYSSNFQKSAAAIVLRDNGKREMGKVLDVFGNSLKIRYAANYLPDETVSKSKASPEVGCFQGTKVCKLARAAARRNGKLEAGKILNVFANGWVWFRYDTNYLPDEAVSIQNIDAQ